VQIGSAVFSVDHYKKKKVKKGKVRYHLLHGSASNVVRTGRSVNGNRPKLMAKTSEFKASCKDSKKLQQSWTYKTAKIFPRTRHVRP
jgi:hypothetical protein